MGICNNSGKHFIYKIQDNMLYCDITVDIGKTVAKLFDMK